MKKKLSRANYIGLRPDVEIQFDRLTLAKAFLDNKEIADIELDEQSESLFQAVLPLLDGTRTVSSIVTTLQQADIAEEAILACLDFLLQSGFSFQFNRPQDVYQATSYAVRSSEPQAILDKITQSKVFLQGQENFCSLIAAGLTGAGVETVEIRLTSPVSQWENWVAETDLIVLFNENWERVAEINAWCIKNKKPLIVGWWKKFIVSFGPLSVPGVTACQNCIYERQGSLYYPDLTPNQIQAGNFPTIVSAANLMAGICVEFLSGASLTRTLTSIYEIDLRRASFTSHPALKNPRCPSCSRLKTHPEGAVIDA